MDVLGFVVLTCISMSVLAAELYLGGVRGRREAASEAMEMDKALRA